MLKQSNQLQKQIIAKLESEIIRDAKKSKDDIDLIVRNYEDLIQKERMKTKPTPRSMALNFAYQENPDINTNAELRQHFRQNPDVGKDHICDS